LLAWSIAWTVLNGLISAGYSWFAITILPPPGTLTATFSASLPSSSSPPFRSYRADLAASLHQRELPGNPGPGLILGLAAVCLDISRPRSLDRPT
jgi:hypothetical protein